MGVVRTLQAKGVQPAVIAVEVISHELGVSTSAAQAAADAAREVLTAAR